MSDDPQGEVKMNEGFVRDAQNDGFCVVFDGPPGPESCRFVEVETLGGRSVRYGEWGQRDDGYWTLTFPAALRPSAGAGEIEALVQRLHIEAKDRSQYAREEGMEDGESERDEETARVCTLAARVLTSLTAPALGVQTEALRAIMEETVMAGYPAGDSAQTLANVRAMRAENLRHNLAVLRSEPAPGVQTEAGLLALARAGDALREHWYESGGGDDMDGSQQQEALLAAGVIAEVPGGYDPEKHGETEFYAEKGDPWYKETSAAYLARIALEKGHAAALPAPGVREAMDTMSMSALVDLVNEQAEDEGLWFVARTAPEAYLQQELRRLHSVIEVRARLSSLPAAGKNNP